MEATVGPADCASCTHYGRLCDRKRPCGPCIEDGTNQMCSLRRKRGRPRKEKPDPNTPKPPAIPKPLVSLRPAPSAAPSPLPSPFPSFPLPFATEWIVASSAAHQSPAVPTEHDRRKRRRYSEEQLHNAAAHVDADDDGYDDEDNIGIVNDESDSVDWSEEEDRHKSKETNKKMKRRDKNKTITTTITSTVLTLLVDELNDMRRSVKAMHRDITKLSTNQISFRDMQQELSHRLDSLPLADRSPSHLSSWDLTMRSVATGKAPFVAEVSPHMSDGARMARLQFMRQFPFLARHNLDTRFEVPFVIDDLEKPFVIVRAVPPSDPTRRMLPVGLIFYGSPAFCQALQYELHELQGCPVSQFALADIAEKLRMMEHLRHRTHPDLSDVFSMRPVLRAKHGNLFKCQARNQIFIDDYGNVTWGLICLDRMEPARAEDIPPDSGEGCCGEDKDGVAEILFPSSSPSTTPTTSSPPGMSSS